jgi:hypothetical protein
LQTADARVDVLVMALQYMTFHQAFNELNLEQQLHNGTMELNNISAMIATCKFKDIFHVNAFD